VGRHREYKGEELEMEIGYGPHAKSFRSKSHEPINIRAANVERIEKHAKDLGLFPLVHQLFYIVAAGTRQSFPRAVDVGSDFV
jgi:hypothetical protein